MDVYFIIMVAYVVVLFATRPALQPRPRAIGGRLLQALTKQR